MSKSVKRKNAARSDDDLDWLNRDNICVALVLPIPPPPESQLGQIIFMDDPNEDLQELFYETLLNEPWLPAKIRRAVMQELGLSVQEENRKDAFFRLTRYQLLIEAIKARMRKSGERPRGGIHDAAMEKVARIEGKTVAAIRQDITRQRREIRRASRK